MLTTFLTFVLACVIKFVNKTLNKYLSSVYFYLAYSSTLTADLFCPPNIFLKVKCTVLL